MQIAHQQEREAVVPRRHAIHCRACTRVLPGSSRQASQHYTCVPRVREVIHLVTESLARPKNVRLRDGRKIRASLREQVAT